MPDNNDRYPGMDPAIQEAIIQKESSGRPSVVGDIGSPEGPSTGLMQIQENTAKGLLRRGMIPNEWKGKKVKRKDLPEVLKDPEYNKLAGAALFVDNKQKLKRAADKNNIPYTPEQLNDWAIKAHNQGYPKTRKREILGLQAVNPAVEEYLKKVKSNLPQVDIPPAYADGGIPGYDLVPDYSPLAPEAALGIPGPVPPELEEQVPEPVVPPMPIAEPPVLMDESPDLVAEPPAPIIAPIEVERPKAKQSKADKKIVENVSKHSDQTADEIKAGLEVIKDASVQAKKEGVPFDPKAEYEAEYKRLKAVPGAKAKAARYAMMANTLKSLVDASTQYAAGKAQAAGGFEIRAPKSTIPTYRAEDFYGKEALAGEGAAQRLATLRSLISKKDGMTEYQRRQLDVAEKGLKLREGAQALREADLKLKEAGEKRRSDQFVFKKGETDKSRKIKVVDAFNSDKQVQLSVKDFVAADKAKKIIDEGGKMAPSVMGRLLARMSGEVGVMTDQDVAAFRGSAQWTDSMERFVKRGLKGTLTEGDKKEMTTMVTKLRDVGMGHYQKRANVIGTTFAVANGADPDAMIAMLQPAIEEYKIQKSAESDKEKLAKGEKIMRDPKSGRNVVVKDGKVLRWAK